MKKTPKTTMISKILSISLPIFLIGCNSGGTADLNNKEYNSLKNYNYYYAHDINYLYNSLSYSDSNINKNELDIASLAKYLMNSTQIIEIMSKTYDNNINTPMYNLTRFDMHTNGINLVFSPNKNPNYQYYLPQHMIQIEIPQYELIKILKHASDKYNQPTNIPSYNNSTFNQPSSNITQINNSQNNLTIAPNGREFIEPNEEDYYSEDEYPFYTNDNVTNKVYPKKILSETFYKLDNANFIKNNSNNGAVLYRSTEDLHVGFVFDNSVDFTNIANKYGIEIKHHYIDKNKLNGGIKKIDLGITGAGGITPDTYKTGRDAFLYLSKNDIDRDNAYIYNNNDKYDAERLALSTILANNLHFEKKFRQNGVICYTMSRDIILIYNALSSGVSHNNIDLKKLKKEAGIKYKI